MESSRLCPRGTAESVGCHSLLRFEQTSQRRWLRHSPPGKSNIISITLTSRERDRTAHVYAWRLRASRALPPISSALYGQPLCISQRNTLKKPRSVAAWGEPKKCQATEECEHTINVESSKRAPCLMRKMMRSNLSLCPLSPVSEASPTASLSMAVVGFIWSSFTK